MGRSLGKDTYRPSAQAGGGPKMRGARPSFVLRRMGFARLLPASLLLAVLTATIVTTALASFSIRALPEALHRRLDRTENTSIQVSGQIGAARASADTPVITGLIRSALGRVPVTVVSGRWSDQLALPEPRGVSQPPLLQAAVLGNVTAHTELAAGTWPGPRKPGQPIGVALPVTTAGMLHMSVGEVLVLPDSLTGTKVRIRVTGLFRPRDPAAPYWRLSLLGTAGKLIQGTFVTYGPMVVNPDALGPGGLGVSAASWLLTVDTGRITPASVGGLGHRLNAAVSALRSRQRLGGLQVATSLPQALAALASSLVVAKSLLLIGSLQLLLLATAAVALAARLLASQRDEENALLSARGVARGQLAQASLAEAALLAVVGAVAGVVLGSYLANLLMSASGLPASSAGGLPGIVQRGVAGGDWWPAVVIMVLVIVLVMWPALRPGTPGAARQRRGRQAVLATAASAGLDAALIALGVLAFWELRRYSAVPRLSGGTLGIDPVLSLAPVLALAGAALLPLRLLPAAARLLDRASARGKRLATALASWQVSRRPVREGGPVLLVVLAVATGTLVLAQHQSWRQSQLDQAAFATGADVRVDLAAPLPLGRGASVAQARGVLAATPVSAVNNGFSVYALGAPTAADTVLLRPDLSPLPAAALWHRITPKATGAGLPLPGRPARLDVTAMLHPPRGGHLGAMSASLSVQDGSGIVYSVPAGDLPADGRYHHLTAGLSAGQARYPLRLLGMSLSYQLPGFPPAPQPGSRTERREAKARATLAIRALAVSAHTSGGFPEPFAQAGALIRWRATATSAALANPQAAGIRPAATAWRLSAGAAALTFKVGAGHVVQRQGVPPLPVSGELALIGVHPALPVPAIATRAFFSAAGAHLGEIVQVPAGNTTVPVRLVAEVRAFPTAGGNGSAVIVDQAWLQQVLTSDLQPPLPVSQWWLRTVRHGVPAGLPAGATVATAGGSAAGLLTDPLPNVPQLSLLVIVIAAGLLAGIGFMVSVVAAVRERRLQDALLAAFGVGRGARAGQLCLEQLMLSVPAAAAGAVIGVVLAHLLVPAVTLTTGATAPFPPVQVVIPLGWIVLLALGIAAVPVLAAAAAAIYRPDPAAQLRAGESA
jgi:FtsX-like permease family